MAERLAKEANYGEYNLYHFNAVTPDTLIGGGTHGTFIGAIIVNAPGTGITITLGNGTTTVPANVFAVITPVNGGNYAYNGVCDKGLYIAIAGTTAGDYTVAATPMVV